MPCVEASGVPFALAGANQRKCEALALVRRVTCQRIDSRKRERRLYVEADVSAGIAAGGESSGG